MGWGALLAAPSELVAQKIIVAVASLGYLNHQALMRTELLRAPLIFVTNAAYHAHGNSWTFIEDQPQRWSDLLRQSVVEANGQPSKNELNHRLSDRLSNSIHRPPPADLLGAGMRIVLFDAQRRQITGTTIDIANKTDLRWLALINKNNQRIGWLALAPVDRATSSANVRFSQRQSRAIWLIAALALLPSAALAYLMSRALLVPVRRITSGIHRLAVGDRETRVAEGGHDEVGQLTRDFNHLARTLEHNERMRRTMMADISHELRTPLSILRGEIEALEDGVRPRSAEAMRSLALEVYRLHELINDLYDLSSSDAGALSYCKTNIDLKDLMTELENAYQTRFADAGLSVAWQNSATPVIVLADKQRLIQLCRNLLENSLRYTDLPNEVVVVLQCRANVVQIRVADSAPGVDAAGRAQLFERFYRVDASRTRARGGAGLGLAICRNIADAHGGTIEAEASAAGGLCVINSLPRQI